MCSSCRSRKTLKNEYLVAKFGFDTEKNEPRQVLQFLAGKLEFNTVVDDRIRQLRFPEELALAATDARLGRGARGRPAVQQPLLADCRQSLYHALCFLMLVMLNLASSCSTYHIEIARPGADAAPGAHPAVAG